MHTNAVYSTIFLQQHLRPSSKTHPLCGSFTTGVVRYVSCMTSCHPEYIRQSHKACTWQVVSRCKPNNAHFALAALEKKCAQEGKRLTLITQVMLRMMIMRTQASYQHHVMLRILSTCNSPTLLLHLMCLTPAEGTIYMHCTL